jgi:hypothetical protein
MPDDTAAEKAPNPIGEAAPQSVEVVEKMSKDDYAIISILYEKVDIMKCVIDLSVKVALNLIDYSLGYEIDC